MNDRERLIQWMQDKKLTPAALAAETGDTRSLVAMIVNGGRPVGDAFKWRFRQAFGDEAANDVFDSATELA